MSSSTTMDASIAHLPDELLANILSRRHSASDCVVSLWLCGDRTLNTRLSRGGCTSFVASIYELIKWPRMLSQLKALRQVVITAEVVHEPIEWMHGVVSNLPSHLEVLHLDFPGSLGLITTEMSVPTEEPWYDQPYSNLMQLSTTFPNLQNLHVLCSPYMRYKYFTKSELHSLPTSLTSLFLDSYNYVSLDCSLYPNLTYYEGSAPSSVDISTMRALRTVTVHQLDSSANLPDLPPCTTHLKLDLDDRSIKLATLNWPSNLTSLECNQPLSAADIRSLPQTVENLTFRKVTGIKRVANTEEETLNANSIWPRNLRSLTLKELETINWSIICSLPPTLTTLRGIQITFKRSIDGLEFSPRLKHLSFSCESTPSKGGSLVLPPNLESLTVSWDLFLVRNFPTSLTHLEIHSLIDPDHISLLPPGILKLSIGGIRGSGGECYEHLPRGLQQLEIEALRLIPNSFKLLPRSLKMLYLPRCLAKIADFTWLLTSIASLRLFGLRDFDAKIISEIGAQIPRRWLIFLMETKYAPYSFLAPLADLWPDEIPLRPMQEIRLKESLSPPPPSSYWDKSPLPKKNWW